MAKASLKGFAFFFDIVVDRKGNKIKCKDSRNFSQVVNKMIVNQVNPAANIYSAGATRYVNQSSATKNVQKKDGFTLSNEAQTFQSMLQKLHNESEVRQDKVDEFSRKIADGDYDVSAENIAASMLSIRF